MAASNEQQRGTAGAAGIANVEQADAWNGEEGERWVAHAERYDATIQRYHRRLLAAADIAAGECVLDVGCGCGQSTRDAARRAAPGRVLGVDLSAPMLARARERSRAEGLENVQLEQADAQVYSFEAETFDVIISRFGAMFFGDPLAAFRNLHRALRPGGRLAIMAWQGLGQNEWLLALREALAVGRELPEPPGGPGPFGLADAAATRRILTKAGFADVAIQAVHERVCVGADADDAFAFARTLGMTKGLLDGLDEATSARALLALRDRLAAHETAEGVVLDSAAWLITARRP